MNVPAFFSGFRLHRLLLLLGSGLSVLVFIVLGNTGVLPLDLSTFLFFSFVMLLFALYRVGWAFLLFVGVLPLEIVNLAPPLLGGLTIRPYQWLAGILFLALGIRFVLKRLPFRLFGWRFFDLFPLLLSGGGFLAIVGAPDPGAALKQAVVVASFVGIYFLGRIFFRTLFDLRQALPFVVLSGTIVLFYAIWQNITFLTGRNSFEVMAGRPNATFSEADWLGLFVILMLGVGYTLFSSALQLFWGRKKRRLAVPALLLAFGFLVLTHIVLMITVARSAWLGALALTLSFGTLLLWRRGVFREALLRQVLPFVFGVVLSVCVAGLSVYLFHLSPFEFWNRIQSTGSGLQTITVACGEDVALPEQISRVEELSAFGCRHIDLEAVEAERLSGHVITTVARPDPNVAIRQTIYSTVWGIVTEHPVLGIGWGSIASFLGTDERGAGLNASNIFLEVWLGSGLLGLVALVLWWVSMAYATLRFHRETEQSEERLFMTFFLSTLIGLSVCNLFNSGILLGFFFLFLSLSALSLERLPKVSLKRYSRKDPTP